MSNPPVASVPLQDAEAVPAWRTDTLAHSVVLLLALTVMQRLVGFLRGVFFCRWLDPQSLGQWDLAFGFLMLAAPVAVLGIPGSFGRYLEFYRQRGQLRSFLRRAGVASLVTGMLGVALVSAWPGVVSQIVFGRSDLGSLAGCLAATLAVVIVYNFLVSLFTALRLFRVATSVQFVQSLGFAAVALAALALGYRSAASIVMAYGAGCLLAVVWPCVQLRRWWGSLPKIERPLAQGALWARLMPFALWMWTVNWLINLFELVDRYLIVHYSGLESGPALAMVGQYHAARVVPLVIYSVASMIAATLTPHLSHDWEAGRRSVVLTRLRLMLKLQALGLTTLGVTVLWGSDLLFGVAFAGKYPEGQAVLGLALTSALWAGLAEIAMNFLWMREKAHLSSLALLVGLVINAGLNLWWVPSLGLAGAAAATMVGKLAMMLLILVFGNRLGLALDAKTMALTLLPVVLCAGPFTATSILAVVGLLVLVSPHWLTGDERRLLAQFGERYLEKWRGLNPAQESAPAA